jgi:hypothetical protein
LLFGCGFLGFWCGLPPSLCCAVLQLWWRFLGADFCRAEQIWFGESPPALLLPQSSFTAPSRLHSV